MKDIVDRCLYMSSPPGNTSLDAGMSRLAAYAILDALAKEIKVRVHVSAFGLIFRGRYEDLFFFPRNDGDADAHLTSDGLGIIRRLRCGKRYFNTSVRALSSLIELISEEGE